MYKVGNPNKNPNKNPLLEDAQGIAIPLAVGAVAGSSSFTYTVPSDRGRVKGIMIYVDSVNQTELIKCVANVSASQVNLLTNSPLIRHGSTYNNNKTPIVCNVEELVQIQVSFSNLSTTVIFNVSVVFCYYDYYVTSLKEINY